MAQVAISVAHVRTMEFATGFLEAVTAPEVTMDEIVNMVNREDKSAYYSAYKF